tara:strand:- start:726 stop:1412 length:687 start_codon:yes stop_codon:yes gene_type:complete
MSSIKLTADSGGGTVELKAPATTTSNAALQFKLPVADGTSGQALTTNASGQLAFADAGGGKILQVKQTIKTDTSSLDPFGAGNAWDTDSFFSLAITPSAATSKIHITGKVNVGVHEGNGIYVVLRVNGAVLTAATGDSASGRVRITSLGYLHGYNIATATYNIQSGAIDIPFDFLHSPSSTSQQTYSLRLYTSHPGSSAGYINRTSNDGDVYYTPRAVSTITAMEVGA